MESKETGLKKREIRLVVLRGQDRIAALDTFWL